MALRDLMMFDGMAPLKAFEAGNKAGIDVRDTRNRQKLGSVMATGDYKQGAKSAFGLGMLDEGSALARLAAQEQEATLKREELAAAGSALAQLLPDQYGGLAHLNPKMATDVFSADQTNALKTSQADEMAAWRQQQIDIANRRLNIDEKNNATPKAPAGYAYVGNELQPIKGGPADPNVKNAKNSRLSPMPAELAARIGLAKNFMGKYEALAKEVASGVFGEPQLSGENFAKRRDMYLRRGRIGEIQRELKGGSEALTRMLTGAGMNMAEAANEVQQYLPEVTDTTETILSKMSQLNERLNAMVTEASSGRVKADTGGNPTVDTQDQGDASGYLGADGITSQDIGGVGDGKGGNPFENDPQFGQDVGGFTIGTEATDGSGNTVYWDGNGWRPQ